MELTRRFENVKRIRGNLQCILRVICLIQSERPTWWHQDPEHPWHVAIWLHHPSQVSLTTKCAWLTCMTISLWSLLAYPAVIPSKPCVLFFSSKWWSINDIISTESISPCWHPCCADLSVRRLLSGMHYGHNCANPFVCCDVIIRSYLQCYFYCLLFSSVLVPPLSPKYVINSFLTYCESSFGLRQNELLK